MNNVLLVFTENTAIIAPLILQPKKYVEKKVSAMMAKMETANVTAKRKVLTLIDSAEKILMIKISKKVKRNNKSLVS